MVDTDFSKIPQKRGFQVFGNAVSAHLLSAFIWNSSAGYGCPPRRGEGRRLEEGAGRRPQLLRKALLPRTRGGVAAGFKVAAWEEGRKERGRDGNPGGGAASRAAESAGAGAARARPRLFLLFSIGVVLRD